MTATALPHGRVPAGRTRAAVARRSGSGPVAAGARRSGTYLTLLATIAVLNVIGVVMVLSASSVVSLTNYGSAWYFFERQLVWTLLGVAAFVVAARVDYRRWRRIVRPLLVVTVVMLLFVLVPGIGVYVSGSRRWLGSVRGGSSRRRSPSSRCSCSPPTCSPAARRSWPTGAGSCARPCSCSGGRRPRAPRARPRLDASCSRLIVAAVLVAGGIRLQHLFVVGGTGFALAAMLAIAAPYRRARVFTFLHPTADAGNTGYQIVQSLIALGHRWRDRCRARGRPGEVALPPERAHRLHLRRDRRGARADRIAPRPRHCSSHSPCSASASPRRAPDRFGMLLAAGDHGLGDRPGRHQHRRASSACCRSRVSRCRSCPSAARRSCSRWSRPASSPTSPSVRHGPWRGSQGHGKGGHGEGGHGEGGRGPMTTARAYAVVTGGGTGGHVYPAIAIADELVRRGHPRGIDPLRRCGPRDSRLVPSPRTGTRSTCCRGVDCSDSLTPRALVDNVGALWAHPSGAGAGLACVWGVAAPTSSSASAGFASCRACSRRGSVASPSSCTSRTPRPGWRTGSRCASAGAPPCRCRGPRSREPCSRAIRSAPRSRRSCTATKPRTPRVGRSSGRSVAASARVASTTRCSTSPIAGAVTTTSDRPPRCRDARPRALRTCPRFEPAAPSDSLVYDLVAYEEHMERLYARADVAVCRAGAVTVAELAAAGVAAVLVPLPGAPGDHQTRNADALVTAGAAVTIPDAQLDGPRLAATLDELLAEPARLATMRGRSAGPRRVPTPRRASSTWSRRSPVSAPEPPVPSASVAALDLATPSRIHVVGVGGAGMSAIAEVLARMGNTVSGSDLKESPRADSSRGARCRRAGGARRRSTCPRAPTRSSCRARSRRRTRRSSRPTSAAFPSTGGPRHSARSPRRGARSRSRAATGRRRRRRCSR